MKMQNELRASKAGRVAKVSVAVGDTVGSGDVLVVVE
jgi:biotin carboxyl carrier protein